MHLGEDNFAFDECAELNHVVLVVHSHFDVESGQRIFLDDGHDKVVGGEFTLIQRTESSLNPVATDLTVVRQLVDSSDTKSVCSHLRPEGLSVASCQQKNFL